jgi:hypothetical protein
MGCSKSLTAVGVFDQRTREMYTLDDAITCGFNERSIVLRVRLAQQ